MRPTRTTKSRRRSMPIRVKAAQPDLRHAPPAVKSPPPHDFGGVRSLWCAADNSTQSDTPRKGSFRSRAPSLVAFKHPLLTNGMVERYAQVSFSSASVLRLQSHRWSDAIRDCRKKNPKEHLSQKIPSGMRKMETSQSRPEVPLPTPPTRRTRIVKHNGHTNCVHSNAPYNSGAPYSRRIRWCCRLFSTRFAASSKTQRQATLPQSRLDLVIRDMNAVNRSYSGRLPADRRDSASAEISGRH